MVTQGRFTPEGQALYDAIMLRKRIDSIGAEIEEAGYRIDLDGLAQADSEFAALKGHPFKKLQWDLLLDNISLIVHVYSLGKEGIPLSEVFQYLKEV